MGTKTRVLFGGGEFWSRENLAGKKKDFPERGQGEETPRIAFQPGRSLLSELNKKKERHAETSGNRETRKGIMSVTSKEKQSENSAARA